MAAGEERKGFLFFSFPFYLFFIAQNFCFSVGVVLALPREGRGKGKEGRGGVVENRKKLCSCWVKPCEAVQLSGDTVETQRTYNDTRGKSGWRGGGRV